MKRCAPARLRGRRGRNWSTACREAPQVLTILVVTRALESGGSGPQIIPIDLDWRQYAILQRLHLLDHRTQIKKLRTAAAAV